MEVVLYNSTVCRLCGEENDNGSLLYSQEENNENLSDIINTYLPIKVSDDGQLPRTICPGCAIQLEATVEFLNLIINGQKVIRELHHREKEYKKSLLNVAAQEQIITEKIIYEVNTSNGVYTVEHPIALQVSGLDRPKRKRGRPPKKQKTPEDLAREEAEKQLEERVEVKDKDKDEEANGKRRRKTPTRFKEVVQGKELERIFKEEGMTDGEESDHEEKPSEDARPKTPEPKEPEVIGHLQDSGELVFVVKGKGRGRPKGRMRPTREQCAICGMQFSSVGRYMSHIAQHGPVLYQCNTCLQNFSTLLNFKEHQTATHHTGQNVIPCKKDEPNTMVPRAKKTSEEAIQPAAVDPLALDGSHIDNNTEAPTMPEMNPKPVIIVESENTSVSDGKVGGEAVRNESGPSDDQPMKENKEEEGTAAPCEGASKAKLKCPHCEKQFSSKQSRSLHVKAAHRGERAYCCGECDARFAYPRSLALHAIAHRKNRHAKGYACDLCGKVLNHPSSVVYHKQAEHTGAKYICNSCGKSFKHKQLLRKHQLVHSQLRPFTCKVCNSNFKTKSNLINHQLLHSGVKKFSCELCKHKFAHKTSLTLHMRWHTGQKPFSCKICGKSFSQKGNLSEHERIHTGEKPFQCNWCSRRFTTSSQHRLHVRRHAADRPYACPNCGKRFLSRSSWVSHMRRESGSWWQRCGVCQRGFADKWALRKHQRLHSGERPFRCALCPRAFADCSNLNKHKRQVHKQVSLLASNNPQVSMKTEQKIVNNVIPVVAEPILKSEEEQVEEVIYVTYDVEDDDTPAAYHIVTQEQSVEVGEEKVVYAGESLLAPREEMQVPVAMQVPMPMRMPVQAAPHANVHAHANMHAHTNVHANANVHTHANVHANANANVHPNVHSHSQVLAHTHAHAQIEARHFATSHHMPVTDEQGNPLHFTMQDGTRLAITSVDGKTLQVVTQDGQTIPVEINGYADEVEINNPDNMIVHQLDLQKTVEASQCSVPHFYAII